MSHQETQEGKTDSLNPLEFDKEIQKCINTENYSEAFQHAMDFFEATSDIHFLLDLINLSKSILR